MPEIEKYVICVVGPTAVGKTKTTIELARKFQTEIISADSRQFFKEMDIGTAKPTMSELSRVRHYFINSHSILEEVSAGRFEKEALKLLDTLFKLRPVVLVTGGSGLYIKALLEGLPSMPAVDGEVRIELNQKLKREGIEVLKAELLEADPEYYFQVDLSNPQRVIRALEVIKSTGKPFSTFRKGERRPRPFKVVKIGLERPRDQLYDRINQRVDKMIGDGLLDEVKSLTSHEKVTALQTVGYKELFRHINGEITLEEAVELIKRNTRRYAKRQLTWFKKDNELHWFHPDDKKDIVQYIASKTQEN